MIYSPDELIELTGKKKYSAQRKVLMAIGMRYLVRPNGSLIVFKNETTKEGPASPTVRPLPPRRVLPSKEG